MIQSTDGLLRAIAHNAYELYSNTIVATTPAQREVHEFMTTLNPGYWVLETSSQQRWQNDISSSIGRLIWCGKLPIHSEEWEDKNEARPLDTYTLLQTPDGKFFWWWDAHFIRIFSGYTGERRTLSALFVSPERKREVQQELDKCNLDWAKDTVAEFGLSGVLDESFESIILDYARKNYNEKVSKEWYPWNILSLFPAKIVVDSRRSHYIPG